MSAPSSALSTPTTSVFVYTRNVFEFRSSWAWRVASGSGPAMTVEVGRPRTTSRARLGPESAQWAPAVEGSSSSSTWLIRLKVSCSRPLAAETTTGEPPMCGAARFAFSRMVCEGTAKMTAEAPSSPTAQSAVTRSDSGKAWPARCGCSLASDSRAASASVRASSRTSMPRRARMIASVVPHVVVPTTAAGPGGWGGEAISAQPYRDGVVGASGGGLQPASTTPVEPQRTHWIHGRRPLVLRLSKGEGSFAHDDG